MSFKDAPSSFKPSHHKCRKKKKNKNHKTIVIKGNINYKLLIKLKKKIVLHYLSIFFSLSLLVSLSFSLLKYHPLVPPFPFYFSVPLSAPRGTQLRYRHFSHYNFSLTTLLSRAFRRKPTPREDFTAFSNSLTSRFSIIFFFLCFFTQPYYYYIITRLRFTATTSSFLKNK